MIAISYLTADPLLLGVEHTDEWLLIVTLGVFAMVSTRKLPIVTSWCSTVSKMHLA